MNVPENPSPFPELPSLPHDENGPVFAEPWQAQAFALAVRLSSQGHFTWKEWAEALAAELAAAVERDEADEDGSEYSDILISKEITSSQFHRRGANRYLGTESRWR